MRHYYYLESKMYSHLPNGYEYQLADGGEMPRIYKHFNTALTSANHDVAFSIDRLGYEVVIPNEENPSRKGDCKFAVRLLNTKTDIRKEIRIYEMYINEYSE